MPETSQSKEKERYPSEWGSLPSVTEILGIIAKPGLIAWYKRQSYANICETSDKALNIGNTVHGIIDRLDAGEKVEVETQYPVEVKNCLGAYFKWKEGKSLFPLHSELKMKSDLFGYKGTLDKVYVCNNKRRILLDWKTSKEIYFDHILQVIAYDRLYRETYGIYIDELWVIRFGKLEPEFEAYRIPNLDRKQLFQQFLNAASLYRAFKTFKKEPSKCLQ